MKNHCSCITLFQISSYKSIIERRNAKKSHCTMFQMKTTRETCLLHHLLILYFLSNENFEIIKVFVYKSFIGQH